MPVGGTTEGRDWEAGVKTELGGRGQSGARSPTSGIHAGSVSASFKEKQTHAPKDIQLLDPTHGGLSQRMSIYQGGGDY